MGNQFRVSVERLRIIVQLKSRNQPEGDGHKQQAKYNPNPYLLILYQITKVRIIRKSLMWV